MALVRKALGYAPWFCLFWSSLGLGAIGQLGAPLTLNSAATQHSWNAIQRCDWVQASGWAQFLDRQDPEKGLLYRLAWLQVPKNQTNQKESDVSHPVWEWERNSEVWQDEVDLISELSQCKKNPMEMLVSFDSLPQEVLKDLLFPRFKFLAESRAPLRSLLLKYAFYLWLAGSEKESPRLSSRAKVIAPLRRELSRALEEIAYGKDWSKKEKCQWDILQFLYHRAPGLQSGGYEHPHSQSDFESLVARCSLGAPGSSSGGPRFAPAGRDIPRLDDGMGLFLASFLVEGGDLYWKNGDMPKAFSLFQQAQENLPGHILPQSLAYRIAVSGFMGGAKDDYSLRIADRLLSEVSAGPSLEPIFKSSLQNLVCGKLVEMQSKEALRVLESIFRPQFVVEKTIAFAKSCSSSELDGLWKLILPKTKDQRQKAHIVELLLKSAIQRNALNEAKIQVSHLAEISSESAFLASHHFWNVINLDPKKAKASESLKNMQIELANFYLSKAQTLSLDSQRLKRLESATQAGLSSDPKGAGSLQMDQYESSNVVRLPFALEVPPVSFGGEQASVSVNFVEALSREFFKQ